MEEYIPPYSPPCEAYWDALLEEGPLSVNDVGHAWEWVEAPAIPASLWEEARELQRQRVILELAIDGLNRGGLIAHWRDIECFIPASHLIAYPFPADPLARENTFAAFLGRTLRLCIIEVEPVRNRLLLSERQVAECELSLPQWPEWLAPGGICEGTVTSVRPFGVFVNIGPLEGMIHISEISWGRVRHPHDFLEMGQEVRVQILNVDAEHQRVGLSLKRLTENPWASVEQYIRVGEVRDGAVVSVERFGVFVELVDGLEGLLHISELEGQLPAYSLEQCYQVGQNVSVRVLEIAPEEHRIALGCVGEGRGYG